MSSPVIMDDSTSMAPGDAVSLSRPGSSQQQDDGNDDPKGKKSNVRKRTKTGCLTCRRRRIKCDENKPTCNNCIKSKRVCEGYNQRVIFKQPISAFQGNYGPSVYPPGSSQQSDPMLVQQTRPSSQTPLQAIAPKPLTPSFGYGQQQPQAQHLLYQPPMPQIQGQQNVPTYDFNYSPLPRSPLPNPLIAPNNPLDTLQFEHSLNQQTAPVSNNNAGGPPNIPHQPSYPLRSPAFDQPGHADFLNLADDSDSDHDPAYAIPESQNPMELAAQQHGGSWQGRAMDIRTYRTFTPSNALTGHVDYSQYVSLFHDAYSHAVFCQFITVTGPCMSLYERQPYDPRDQRNLQFDARLEKNIWSYTFPIVAAAHRPLLTVMLALGSLQMTKLEGKDIEPINAWKYYSKSTLALKKCLSSPTKRVQAETLAATLLLGYFEVWSSDHTKWCRHLKGASILLAEIPLENMSRVILPVKRMIDLQRDQRFFDASATELNYILLGVITGSHVTPEQYGLGVEQPSNMRNFSATEKDIRDYDNYRDLFWWYCKMDVYQSILGGTKLLMDYKHWTQCPPRARISNLDTVYGTFDHLILLLGRLARFISKDLPRKRKINRSPPAAFPGMLPAQEKVRAPSGFTARGASPTSETNDDAELMSRETALQEWECIRTAFEAFESSLDAGFEPLSGEYEDHRETPFGSALQYRSYGVAGIWLNYYMGLICLHRSHPDMPPAAMQAASIVAPTTARFAMQAGRIAAGLSGDLSKMQAIPTILSAALLEASFCLFVAAIQFKDDRQRHWVVQLMSDITRLTGWQSAQQVAKGCESAWAKAAQLGRGPPYVRPPHLNEDPISVWQNPRRIDQEIQRREGGGEQMLVLHAPDQTQYALGLLGVENDLEVLQLNE